jgi:hypothetical protein
VNAGVSFAPSVFEIWLSIAPADERFVCQRIIFLPNNLLFVQGEKNAKNQNQPGGSQTI